MAERSFLGSGHLCSAGNCGDSVRAGIKAGQLLKFTLMYPSGLPTQTVQVGLQSVARQVSISPIFDRASTSPIALLPSRSG